MAVEQHLQYANRNNHFTENIYIREEGKMYQINVIGVKRKPVVIDIATSESAFNKTTIEQLKRKLKDKLPGRHII